MKKRIHELTKNKSTKNTKARSYTLDKYTNTQINKLTKNRQIALLTIRLLLGFIFFFQGFGKIFKFGMENVYNNFFAETYKDVLPEFLLQATAYYTSYVEFLGGILLIIGLKRDYTLYALASVLIIVTFGHGLVAPIWDLSHVMYRAILLLALLLLPKEWDQYRLDTLLKKK
ncbi:MAG: DoxX family membrane protein [Bacteroidota bacterium]